MPIDASIYGNIQKPENPLDAYGKALNLKALMGQSRLQELQTTKTERDLSEEQALHDVFSNAPSGATLESLVPAALRASPRGGIDLQGKLLKQKELQGNIDKTQLELTAKSAELHREQLANVNDPQSAAQWVQAGYADPHIAPILSRGGTVEQAIARIPQDQAQFQEWKAKNGMGIQKFLEMQNTNREHAANRDVTIRGQDMTDVRQRELNGIMEGSTNTPSPALVKGIASGEIPLNAPPTNARNPIMLERYGKLLDAVKAENPNWSAEMHPTIKKTVAAFSAGAESKTVKKLNTATDHLDTMRELVAATKNGNVQLFNKIANQFAANTGNAAPSNLATAAQIIGAEIVGSIVGAGGGVGEREKAENAFSNIKSPADAEGAIQTVEKLMGGQFKGMRQQYEAGTYGRKDFDRFLSPAAKKALETADKAKETKTGDQVNAQPGRLIPTKGAVQDGYRFKGGDPSKAESWEKV